MSGGGGGAKSEVQRIRDARAGNIGNAGAPSLPAPKAKKEFVWPPVLPGPARPRRRVVRASQAFLDYERARKTEKSKVRVDEHGKPLIKVVLKSKPDSTANVDLLGGGGAKEDGLNVQTFSKSIRLWLSEGTMLKCAYFKKMLGRKWKGKTAVSQPID